MPIRKCEECTNDFEAPEDDEVAICPRCESEMEATDGESEDGEPIPDDEDEGVGPSKGDEDWGVGPSEDDEDLRDD